MMTGFVLIRALGLARTTAGATSATAGALFATVRKTKANKKQNKKK